MTSQCNSLVANVQHSIGECMSVRVSEDVSSGTFRAADLFAHFKLEVEPDILMDANVPEQLQQMLTHVITPLVAVCKQKYMLTVPFKDSAVTHAEADLLNVVKEHSVVVIVMVGVH